MDPRGAGGDGLSRREREIAALVADGLSNGEIAERLFIAQRTAEGHVERILSKLGFRSRAQIAAWVVSDAPLRTADRPLSNLPPPTRALVGRDEDVAALLTLLRRRPASVVTLTGPGGVGKTRLALEVARRAIDDFEHGVWFVDLTPLRDPELVLMSVGGVLRVRQLPGKTVVESIARHLTGKSMLLVLDNFEHVIAAAPAVSQLLNSSTESTILVTSREPLRLYAEHEYSVEPLPAESADVESPAVRLFVERAEDAQPAMEFSPADLASVGAICERLDGLPLAIELAAARSRILRPEEILARLARSLTALATGQRDAPPRHRALAATFAWSYDLLSADERVLFQRVAVFRGGFDVSAAENICAGGPVDREAVLDLIDSLVAKSLLRAETTALGSRIQMLQTVHDFAGELLESAPELASVRDRHARWYRDLSEREANFLNSGEQLAALARVDADINNYRAALDHSRDSADNETWLRIATSLSDYWRLRGLDGEGIEEFGLAPLDDPNIDADLRAEARLAEIRMRLDLGDIVVAADSAYRLADVALSCRGQARFEAWSDLVLSIAASNQGASDHARKLGARAAGSMRVVGSPYEAAFAVMSMGELEREAGATEAAIGHYAEAVRLLEENAVPRFFLWTTLLFNLGLAQLTLGDLPGAEANMRASLDAGRELHHTVNTAYAVLGLAAVGQRLGRGANAARLLGAADACLIRAGAALSLVDQTTRDSLERELQDALGSDAYEACYRSGANGSIDEALAAYDSEPLASYTR